MTVIYLKVSPGVVSICLFRAKLAVKRKTIKEILEGWVIFIQSLFFFKRKEVRAG